MARAIIRYGLYQALLDEGYKLPDECADVEIHMPVDGLMQLKLYVNLTDVTLAQVGRAFVRMTEASQKDRTHGG